MEQWDLYDQNRTPTGKVAIRGEALAPGEFRLVAHVCIINADDQMLVQQRQPFKEGWPNKWDLTVGGSALKGENSQQAAVRELFEEIGFQANLEQTRPIFTVNFNRGFDDFYVIKAEANLMTLTLKESEVQGAKWASRDEILEMIDTGEFISYHKSLIHMIFDMKDRHGAHRK